MKKMYLFTILASLISCTSISLFASQPLLFATECGRLSSNCHSCSNQEWTLFTKLLGEKIGQEVQLTCQPSVDRLVRQLERGKVDFAYMKQMTYSHVKKSKNGPYIQPIANAIEPNGRIDYSSVFVAPKQAGKITLDDIKNKKIGFVKGSTSGEYLPVMVLKKKGLYHSQNSIMYNTHKEAFAGLEKGQVFGIFTHEYLQSQYPKFQLAFSLSPKLASPLLVVNRKKMDAQTIEKLKKALPNIKMNWSLLHGFKPCKNKCNTMP